MQFSKFMPLVCAAIFCAGFVSTRAADNPAQAAARAALEQKMSELDAQQSSTNAEPPPAIIVTPSGVTQEQPAPTAPVSLESTPTPSAETIQHSMMPLPGSNPPATPGTVEMQPAPAPAPADTEAQARALQALQQKMSELNQQTVETPAPAPAVPVQTPAAAPETKPIAPVAAAPEKPANADYPGMELGLKPIEPPPLPISADKQAQLQALLAIYKADKITPAEYQAQRAKILAEP
jgi:hypothetical protein